MRNVLAITCLTVVCAASIAAAGPATSAIWGTDGAAVTNDTLDQLTASVSGDKAVWSEYEPSGDTDNVVGYDFSQKIFFDVSSLNANETRPVISGNVVAWVSDQKPRPYTDVFIQDLETGDKVNISEIADSTGKAGTPSIHGDFVAWDDLADEAAPLRVYHIPSGTELEIPARGGLPDIWSDGEDFRLVWEDETLPQTTITMAQGAFDVTTGEFSSVVTETVWDMFPAGTPAQTADMSNPSIWGDVIAWIDWRAYGGAAGLDVYAFDMATERIHEVGVADDHDSDPQVFDGWVAWEHWRGGNTLPQGPLYSDTYAFSLAEEASVRVTSSDTPKAGLVFEGRRMVWIDLSAPDNEVKSTVIGGPALRYAGPDRYSTAVTASRLHFSSSNTVVLVTGQNHPDALAASSLAGAYECPILLTPSSALPWNVKTEIGRLGATQIVIVGGYGAISQELEESLGSEYAVRRISGPTRYDTAGAVATEARGIWGTDGAGRTTGIWGTDGAAREKTIFVARGDDFADVLAASPIAYGTGIPVLLTRPGALAAPVADFMDENGTTEVIILGGTGAVSGVVQAQIDAILDSNGGTPSTRWAGATRYETATEIAAAASVRGWASLSKVGFVTGRDFPDALAGGSAVGIGGGVLLMVDPADGSVSGSAAAGFVETHHAGVGQMEVFGGTGVVGDSAVGELEDAWAGSFADTAPSEDPTFFEPVF